MKIQSADFFNWSNNPWRGSASEQYANPGYAYSSSALYFLGENAPVPGVLERPEVVIWESAVGHGSADGSVMIQLYAKGGDDPVHGDPSLCPSFRSICELEVSGLKTGVNHVWHQLTADELDRLQTVPFQYGLILGVRQKSLDGICAPVWYSSKLLVKYA